MAVYLNSAYVANAATNATRFYALSLNSQNGAPASLNDFGTGEYNATNSMTYWVTTSTSGVLPAGIATTVDVILYEGNTGTVIDSMVHSNPDGLVFPLTGTLNPTATGASGGAPIIGDVRLYVRVQRIEPGVGTVTYDQNSDTQATQGVVRFNPTSLSVVAAAPTAGKFVFNESAALTVTASNRTRNTRNLFEVRLVRSDNGDTLVSGFTNASNTTTHSQTVGSFGNNIPAGLYTVAAEATVRAALLAPTSNPTWRAFRVPTGIPGRISDTTVRDVTTYSLDNRITVDHHLQVNDNTFHATDPGSKDKIPKYRLVAEMGFMGVRLTNARGEGINGITYSESLSDANAFASPVNRSPNDTTVTRGTQAGWSSLFKAWDSQLPSGQWVHNITITSPLNATGLEVGKTQNFVLLAPNPAISVRPYVHNVSPTGGGGSDHAQAGQILRVVVTVVDTGTGKRITVDPDTMAVTLIRYNSTEGYLEYLQDENDNADSWTRYDPAEAATTFTLAQSLQDPMMYVKDFYPTTQFKFMDLRVAVTCTVADVPYHQFSFRELVGKASPHGSNIEVITSGGPVQKSSHWSPGQPFQAGLTVMDLTAGTLVSADSAAVAVFRLQDSGPNIGLGECLVVDATSPTGWSWRAVGEQGAEFHTVTQARPGSKVYTRTWSSTVTADWGEYDIFVLGRADIGLFRYTSSAKEIGTADSNAHDGNTMDVVQIGMHGVVGFK